MTNQTRDPAVEWSALLDRLDDRRREAVVSALRHSAQSGWPANAASVQLLVSYAIGDIDARTYAGDMLVALGYAPIDTEAAEPVREPVALPEPPMPSIWGHDALDEPPPPAEPEPEVAPERPPVGHVPPSTLPDVDVDVDVAMSREEAVQAYVTGLIPVEQFLRISRNLPSES